jgi:transcription termination factor NusB
MEGLLLRLLRLHRRCRLKHHRHQGRQCLRHHYQQCCLLISKQQDDLLEKVKELVEKNVNLEKSHEKMLKSIEEFQKHHETVLNQILQLDKKIDHLLKK